MVQTSTIFSSPHKFKKKRILIIHKASSSEKVESINEVESSRSKKLVLKANESPPIFGKYVASEHTRPKNKLRQIFNIMENSQLKDVVFNVDEDSPPKGK